MSAHDARGYIRFPTIHGEWIVFTAENNPQLVRAIAEALAQIRRCPAAGPAIDPLRPDDLGQDHRQAG